jgi:hypothetical protein
MDGIIDDVVLVNKALSQVEINSLMTKGIIKGSAVEPTGKLAVNWGNIKGNTQ